MNYSDYDSDDYASNEDDDYVPSDDNLSEDDLNECVPEEGFEGEGEGDPQGESGKKKKKKKGQDITARKRKKLGLKLDNEGDPEVKGEEEAKVFEENEDVESSAGTNHKEKEQKKKADDLWASFLSDVGQRPKVTNAATDANIADKTPSSTDCSDKKGPSPAASDEDKKMEKASSKITITQVFDFAGEEVRVTKEVEANSREAKNHLKKGTDTQSSLSPQKTTTTTTSSSPGPSPSVGKRPAPPAGGGMTSLLSRIGGKKPKMSTLEKSRLDWDAFKTEEGISDELAIHNRGKEGFVERKNFLERVDQRQFQLERDVRLSNMKR